MGRSQERHERRLADAPLRQDVRAYAYRDWAVWLAAGSAGLFLVSAGISTLLAYDLSAAAPRLAGMVVGLAGSGLLVWAGLRDHAGILRHFGVVASLLALAGALWVRAGDAGDLTVVAGLLVLLLPMQAGALWLAYRHGQGLAVALLGGVLLGCAGLLLLSGERSAWLALGIGALSAACYAQGPNRHARQRWLQVAWSGLLVVLGICVALVVAGSPWLARLPPGVRAEMGERATIWPQLLGLGSDYRFTGSGLGTTAMVASSYLFLLHVPLYHHAHQMLLQIFLEQGIAGVVAFLGLTVATGTLALRLMRLREPWLRVSGVCALAAICGATAHGLLDSELYASVWMPALFLPFGYSAGVYAFSLRYAGRRAAPEQRRQFVLFVLRVGTALVVTCLGLWWGLGGCAAWDANLGAVAQTRAELSLYRWPAWGWQDELRRLPEVDLAPAITLFEQALDADPSNLTALRRLGQIALSRGEVDRARNYLQTAYSAYPQDRAVRQLLGEYYALDGAWADAVQLWETIDLSHDQLEIRQAWYTFLDDSYRFQRMQEAVKHYERGLAAP